MQILNFRELPIPKRGNLSEGTLSGGIKILNSVNICLSIYIFIFLFVHDEAMF